MWCLLLIGFLLAVPVPVAAGPYAPAHECARCHPVMVDSWDESAHARSASNPAFLRAVGPLLAPQADPAVGAECIRCHAPGLAGATRVDAGRLLADEGITCDACHTLADVAEPPSRAGGSPFVGDPGPVKRGPLPYTESPWHGTALSPLFTGGPALCSGCHEHLNVHGVAVLTAWSEWREGPWPDRGLACQDCHMPLEPGTPAVRAVGGASRRVVSLHRFAGSDSRSRLHHALDLEIAALHREGPRLEVTVRVRNSGVGHDVPGGLPGRSLVLVAGIETDGSRLALRQERAWGRVVLDERGRVLEEPADIFLNATAEGPDTRLRAGETRDERFAFDLPRDARVLVVRLDYSDRIGSAGGENVLISEVRRNLAP